MEGMEGPGGGRLMVAASGLCIPAVPLLSVTAI